MAERSDDIDTFDFDFFEEPATEEAAQREQPRKRGGPRRPVRPPSGIAPLLRLFGLIAFAIAVVVVLVLWVQSCRAESKRDQYGSYLGNVRSVARESDTIGNELVGLFTSRGISQTDMADGINSLAARHEQVVDEAQDVDAPGRLRTEHEHAIDALELRTSGLRLLAQAFAQGTTGATGGNTSGGTSGSGSGNENATSSLPEPSLLAEQMRRFVASDVIWDDLYRAETEAELRQQAVLGVTVPDSDFLDDPELATTAGMRPVVNRIRGATTGGRPTGKHGNGITQVRALPDGTVLQTDADNTVTLTPELQMEVTVENSGDSQEVQVPVRLTLQQSPEPITKTRVLNVIDPGETKRVVFSDFDRAQIGQQTQLKVEVEPVQGEENTANNTRQYAVTFLFTPAE